MASASQRLTETASTMSSKRNMLVRACLSDSGPWILCSSSASIIVFDCPTRPHPKRPIRDSNVRYLTGYSSSLGMALPEFSIAGERRETKIRGMTQRYICRHAQSNTGPGDPMGCRGSHLVTPSAAAYREPSGSSIQQRAEPNGFTNTATSRCQTLGTT
ncbi:hypothetical protein IQ07DRAFT_602952 [Pyrenochaeta sp. DS3sAY3a]|nr:hypothetical protein IQ07DRAFT_602952 [Pyrenochaeta sp. DS3sAY3a]